MSEDFQLDNTKRWGMVCYTDGGARPNPGFVGYGIHGYIYELPETIPTVTNSALRNTHSPVVAYVSPGNKGYIAVEKKPDQPDYTPVKALVNDTGFVTPVYYLDLAGSDASIGTNNQAEMRAMFSTLQFASMLPIKELHICADSMYTIEGLTSRCPTWSKMGWRTREGNPVANQTLWENMWSLYQKMIQPDSGINVKLSWVKGHNYSFGNSSADWLATIGVFKSKDINNAINVNKWFVTPAKKYFKADVDRHPLLCFKRSYFNRLAQYNTPGMYYMADPGASDDVIGKRIPEAGYSIVKLYQPDTFMELIRERQHEFAEEISSVMMLKMDKLFSKEVADYIQKHGKYCLQPALRNANIEFLDKQPVTVERDPIGLMMRTLESMNFLEELLNKFVLFNSLGDFNRPENFQQLRAFDITDSFYNRLEKKVGKELVTKHELKREIAVGYIDHLLEIETVCNGKNVKAKIPLILGIDIPPRNSLKTLEKKCPKVHLLIWKEAETTLRYATIVECTDGIGIWSNFHADRILLTLT